MLNILHASWPAGIVIGGVVYLTMFTGATSWAEVSGSFWFMFLPVIAYGVMFLMCHHYPVDERVEAKVPMSEMLKEFGGAWCLYRHHLSILRNLEPGPRTGCSAGWRHGAIA